MSPTDPDELEAIEGRLRALESTVEQLLDVLVGREVLNDGHRRLLAKVGERAARRQRPPVQLRATTGDKYEVTGPTDIDCASLLHLCRARCCSLNVRMTRQDLDEGKLEWEIEQPYILRKADDGYCSYLAGDGRCGCYSIRPMTCREFDCREDPRIWTDFEKRIPAPYGLVRSYEAPGDE